MTITPPLGSGESFNIESTSTYAYQESPDFQALSPQTQDTLELALSPQQLNVLFDAPTLEGPVISLSEFFAIINNAAIAARQQLGLGELVDQETRTQMSRAVAFASLSLEEQIAEINRLKAEARREANESVNTIQSTVNEVVIDVGDQLARIRALNGGNATERAQAQALITGYNKYISDIEALGAQHLGNGRYRIPSTDNGGPQDKARIAAYNTAVDKYNHDVVDPFNNYWAGRYAQINQYNSDTSTYNSDADKHNAVFNEITTKYELADDLAGLGLNLTQPKAEFRSINGFPSQVSHAERLPNNAVLPYTVNTNRPNNNFFAVASNGVANLPEVAYTAPTLQQYVAIFDAIYQYIYDKVIAPLQVILNEEYQDWGFLFLSTLLQEERVEASASDPLEGIKALIRRILPEAFILQMEPKVEENKTGGGTLAIQVSGLGNPHMAALMGEGLLTQIVNETTIDLTELQKSKVVDQLLVLASSLIGASSLLALLPSLGLIDNITAIVQNPSLFDTIFAAALAGSILDQILKGGVEEALRQFLEVNPALQDLSAADRTALLEQFLPALNLTLALTATSLIASTIGAPQLLPSILGTAIPESLAISLNLPQVFSDQTIDFENQLRPQLTQRFLDEGFTSNQSDFLADVGTEIAPLALSPTPSIISEETINRDVLRDSITAGIILADRNADVQITQGRVDRAIERTLTETQVSSTQQFRESLEYNLRQEGLTGAQTEEGLRNAVITSPSFSVEQFLGLGPEDILVFVSSQLSTLFTQIGAELGRRVAEAVTIALYGRPDPDSGTVADVKSPYSLVNVIRDAIQKLTVRQDQVYFNMVRSTFEYLIEDVIKPSEFLQTILQPAHMFLYSIGEGIMYSEPADWKKSIDIPI